ncbi:MAG: hypothetical protein HOP19_25175 [Acidobacteria bacterium]|nr:hypothetical protein [Acidobacteriota bacterium]
MSQTPMVEVKEATKQRDVDLILKLYELRREKEMRTARVWYFAQFNPTSAADLAQLIANSQQSSAHYRMLTSYWDMAASFVLNGGIDEQIFQSANTEHVAVFAKLEPYIAEMRVLSGESDYLIHLERLVMKTPNVKAILERRRKLFAAWIKTAQREQSGR